MNQNKLQVEQTQFQLIILRKSVAIIIFSQMNLSPRLAQMQSHRTKSFHQSLLSGLMKKGPIFSYIQQILDRSNSSIRNSRITLPLDANSNIRVFYICFLQQCFEKGQNKHMQGLLKFKTSLYDSTFSLEGYDSGNFPAEFFKLYTDRHFKRIIFEFLQLLVHGQLIQTICSYPIVDYAMIVYVRRLLGDSSKGLWKSLTNASLIKLFNSFGLKCRQIQMESSVFFTDLRCIMKCDRNNQILEPAVRLTPINSITPLKFNEKHQQIQPGRFNVLAKTFSPQHKLVPTNLHAYVSNLPAKTHKLEKQTQPNTPYVSKSTQTPSTKFLDRTDDDFQKDQVVSIADKLQQVASECSSSQILEDSVQESLQPAQFQSIYCPPIVIQERVLQHSSSKRSLNSALSSPKSNICNQTPNQQSLIYFKTGGNQSKLFLDPFNVKLHDKSSRLTSPVFEYRLNSNEHSRTSFYSPNFFESKRIPQQNVMTMTKRLGRNISCIPVVDNHQQIIIKSKSPPINYNNITNSRKGFLQRNSDRQPCYKSSELYHKTHC